jgi:tetratricopeptide (TPR) repeat protein
MRPLQIVLLLSVSAAVCAGQQATPAATDELEPFAFELVNSSAAKRTELLASHQNLIGVGLRQALVRHGNVSLVSGKYAPALEIYRLAERVAEQIGDKEGVAATALNIGSVHYSQGNYESAIENYRRAHELFLSLTNRSDAARALLGIALTFQAQKKFAEALKTFEQALTEFELLNDEQEIANALAGVGSIQYEQGNYDAATKTFMRLSRLRDDAENLLRIAEGFYRQDDFAQALTYYQESLNKTKGAAQTISALNGAANCYYYQRNYDEALNLYNRSLALSESVNDKSGVATQLQNIGNIYRAVGDYASALQSYFKSVSAAAGAPTRATVATTLGSIGIVRSLQGDNLQAIEYFDKSLHEFETNGDHVGMSRMLSYIGNAQYLRGNYDLALAAYEKSLSLHRSRNDKVNQAHVMLGIGAVYVNQQKFPAALENYQHALAIYESLARQLDAADVLIRLAALHRLQGEYTTGLEFANRAALIAQENDSPALHSLALTEAGRLQRSLKRQTEALDAFTRAIDVQGLIGAEAALEGSGTARPSVLPYLGAMEVLIDQNNALEAFTRADDAKAQVLRELVNSASFRVTKELTTSERHEENTLLGDLASLRLQLNKAQDAANKDDACARALRNRLTTARHAYESFRKQLYAKHPRLAVNRGELRSLKPEEIRRLVRRDTAILEYAVTDDSVFLFVVTNDATLNVKAHRLELKPKELAERSSHELYDLLLKPAEQQIATKANVIIIPDGVVWDLPLETLQTSPNQTLGNQKNLSYSISVSALNEMRKRRPTGRVTRGETVLVLGNPVLNDELVKRLETTYTDLRPREAIITSDEIDSIRSAYAKHRVRLYSGAGAARERVTKEPSSFIYFATPALFDHSAPLYSFTMLSPGPGGVDDGLLKLREVINLDSRAGAVVYQAPSFAGTHSGNAYIATSWAWFIAGTPTVILNRSKVNSEILKLPRSKNEKPYDWSGLIVIGNSPNH